MLLCRYFSYIHLDVAEKVTSILHDDYNDHTHDPRLTQLPLKPIHYESFKHTQISAFYLFSRVVVIIMTFQKH